MRTECLVIMKNLISKMDPRTVLLLSWNVFIPLLHYNIQPDGNRFLTGGQAMCQTHLHAKCKPVAVRKFRARLCMQNAYLCILYRYKVKLSL
jgi:hypothetical protein